MLPSYIRNQKSFEMSSKRALKSSNRCAEVFEKAMLSLSPSDLSKETKSRQKRKERQPRPKTTVQKAATTKRQKSQLGQVKTKTQLANRENEKSSESRGIKSSIAEKLSLMRNPKVISSEPITNTKRKPLGSIQSSSVNKRPSVSTSNRLEKDLRRVLAKDEGDKQDCVVLSDIKTNRNKKELDRSHVNHPAKDETTSSQLRRDLSRSSSVSESDMDTSANGNSPEIPLKEISLRLVEGLQTDVIFPDSNYLGNIKAELKKLMKQSDPEAYSQLMICISGKYEETPVINNAVLSEQDNTDTTGSFNMFLPRFFDAATGTIPDPTEPIQSSTLLPPIIQHSVSNPMPHLNISPAHFHLPTVILHPDIEPSCEAEDNMLSQPSLLGDGHMTYSSAPSVDFLDYLDAGSLDSVTDTQYGGVVALPSGMECNHAVDVGGNPAHQWIPSPDRPRMFPRKLY